LGCGLYSSKKKGRKINWPSGVAQGGGRKKVAKGGFFILSVNPRAKKKKKLSTVEIESPKGKGWGCCNAPTTATKESLRKGDSMSRVFLLKTKTFNQKQKGG